MWTHLLLALALAQTATRDEISLDGVWEITTQDPFAADVAWQPIDVPAAWENTLGADFDGVATYRTQFHVPDDFRGERLVLHFAAVATEAHVWLNDERIGTHLGGWTAFRLDVTPHVRRGEENLLLVAVNEKVGHNTQGFLPIIAPHFGGIWQSVALLGLPEVYFDDLGLLLIGEAQQGKLIVEAPFLGEARDAYVTLEAFIGDQRITRTFRGERTEIPVTGFEAWDFDQPALYPVTLRLLRRGGVESDRLDTRVAFRTLAADGRRLLLNGSALSVRGLLEWGYYPPSFAPDPGPDRFLTEIADAKARGFNLIKFCLWLPPRWMLDLLDEAGMLAWIEYPTWHPQIDAAHRAELNAEFDEFFRHDRNHPAVLLRSLTCETGHSADLEVIKDLYQRAKSRIPDALVEDDSSWIDWHRIHDFYDDHPYGNNDQWPATLRRLDEHIAARAAKPLLLGEAIAADTWLARTHTDRVVDTPFAPICLDAQIAWEDRVATRYGMTVLDRLLPDSLRFGLAERKDQIETYRLMVPDGGYVVSVARDFPKARMGLNDDLDRPKWRADEWSWHGDSMLVLDVGSPRSLRTGTTTEIGIHLAHYGAAPIASGRLRYTCAGQAGMIEHPEIAPGSVIALGRIPLIAPAVDTPRELTLSAALDDRAFPVRNSWRFWAFPEPPATDDANVLVADAMSIGLFDRLRNGASVLILPGDGPGAFVRRSHWFLRGSVWFPPSPLLHDAPPELFIDLAVKDLHPSGLLPLAALAPHVDPLVGFWDTHDNPTVDDFAMAFETRVGAGRLLVSAFPRDGSAASDWLTARFRQHLALAPAPAASLPDDVVQAIFDRITGRTLDLVELEWQFRPDDAEDERFVPIHVGRSWEGQGFPNLDGWATYRLALEIPREWGGEPLYANFEGVDDAYEVYLDGTQRGSGGDIQNRLTAFAEPATFRLSDAITPGPHTLDVRVYDWYGAGGIHRPVSLSTKPLGVAAEFLRGQQHDH